MKLLKKNIGILSFCLIISFVLLAITSKCSFLYPFNDWVDANAFFTVGKGIFKGVVPYLDVFEQKGPILYFIYGIASLISYKSFIGVFVFEVISFTILLFYFNKIIKLFLNEKYSYIILPIMGTIICTCNGFVHGGSCEEFCLPLVTISLYYYIYHFKVKRLSYKELVLNGIFAGLILMMKYSILGFSFGFMAFIFFDYLFRAKDVKRAFLSCIFFLMGMLLPVLICLLYLGINGAISDFINEYFIINITAYGSEKMNVFVKIYKLIRGFCGALYGNGIIFVLYCLIPVALWLFKINKYFVITLFVNIVLMTFGIYSRLHFYSYYILPLFVFGIMSLILVFMFYDQLFKNKDKLFVLIASISALCCGILTYMLANYRYMILMPKEGMFQYNFANYINRYDNPTLLNMGYLDAGLYTTTGILPNTKFFEVQNISYERFPDNLDDMKTSVINKKVMFILYYGKNDIDYIMENHSYILDDYHLVLSQYDYSEYEDRYAYLFQLN